MRVIRKLAWWWYVFYVWAYTQHQEKHARSDFEVCPNVLCWLLRGFDNYYLENWSAYNCFMHNRQS